MYIEKGYSYEPASKLIITLAPTGMIPTKEDTKNVPLTPDEIVKDAYEGYKLGVSIVHIHARDEQGKPTHKKAYFEEIFEGIKRKCPDVIICATTSGRVDPQVEHRSEVLDLYPEMASLTMGSLNFPRHPSVNSLETIMKLAKMMTERSICPELEIFEPGFINTAKYLVHIGILREPLHFNLLLGSLGSMSASLRDLSFLVDSLPSGSTWSATGIGRFQTQINAAAILMGGHVRVGIEDSIYYSYPKKELATNTDLVKRIVRLATELGRDVATPSEARNILGLSI
ncbi:MAG: 3-keto-5-aminohexanoate cleavage protein [Candidatus Thermoplasmatota archaeon]|nr:3-keto-5-aminohexanoate cleavage protein [Candidatus Thermoplasmatota archaeon]